MRKFVVITILAFVLVAIAFVVWKIVAPPQHIESSGDVLKAIFDRAEKKDYSGAAEFLEPEEAQFYLQNADLASAIWDSITKESTVAKVSIQSQLELDSVAIVKFQVAYTDGSTIAVEEHFSKIGGKWRTLLGRTVKQAAPDFDIHNQKQDVVKLNLQARKTSLNDKPTVIPEFNLEIRLPQKSQLDLKASKGANNTKIYSDLMSGITVDIVDMPGIDVQNPLATLERRWSEKAQRLDKKEKVEIGGRVGMVVRGGVVGNGWEILQTVLGTKKNSVEIIWYFPKNRHSEKLVNESFKSLRFLERIGDN